MKTSSFRFTNEGINDQGFEENILYYRVFDINQHKEVTKFLDMNNSKEYNAKVIFGAIDVFQCVSLDLGNNSVKIGCHNSVKVEAKNNNIILMGPPCHITHNTAKRPRKHSQ